MDLRSAKPTSARAKTKKEETQDKNGHWSREFHVRSEAWPVVEHWVAEHGYHLTASRGKRRIYYRGADTRRCVTLLDIKVENGLVKMSAWIQVGWISRLFSFFRLPHDLVISPKGSLGARARREACRELNSLLIDLKQPVIAGSVGFHPADIDPTTLWLASLFVIPAGAYLGFSLSHWDFRAGLSHALILATLKPLGWLALTAVGLVSFHHFAIVRFLGQPIFKTASLALCLALFSVLSVAQLTHAAADMEGSKVAFYCLEGSASRCQAAFDMLKPEQRAQVRKRLEILQKELARAN